MVAARSTLSESGGQLIWFGTPYLGENYYANLQYLIATMNTVCEKEASVTIAAKSLMSDSLTVPDGSSSFWLAIMCVVVPVAVTASVSMYGTDAESAEAEPWMKKRISPRY